MAAWGIRHSHTTGTHVIKPNTINNHKGMDSRNATAMHTASNKKATTK
jgi:hypothetical protein